MERTLVEPLRDLNIALVVVDFQNDFIDGSLGIKVDLLPLPIEDHCRTGRPTRTRKWRYPWSTGW